MCGLQSWLNISPTYLAPSHKTYMGNGDVDYAPYNLPLGVLDFLEKSPPEEEWIIILDPDILFRQPILCPGAEGPEASGQPPSLVLPCKRGQPISSYTWYLNGCENDLATRYLPDVEPRNDTNGGLKLGRRADKVGQFFVVHRDDINQYIHDWLNITANIRMDRDVRFQHLLFAFHGIA
jgi:hypothetical protein